MQRLSKSIYKYRGWTVKRCNPDQWKAENGSRIQVGTTLDWIKKCIDNIEDLTPKDQAR